MMGQIYLTDPLLYSIFLCYGISICNANIQTALVINLKYQLTYMIKKREIEKQVPLLQGRRTNGKMLARFQQNLS